MRSTFVAQSVGLALALLTLLPATARAQSAIAGVVKDSSGAVLPGVTVEAASAALIEKTRSAVTDAAGENPHNDLRPGKYTGTFTPAHVQTGEPGGGPIGGWVHAAGNAENQLGAVSGTIT